MPDLLSEIDYKGKIHGNLSVQELTNSALQSGEAKQAKNAAIVVYTGKYTGRSPDDRFIVESSSIKDNIDWGKQNLPISEEAYNQLYDKMMDTIKSKDELYVFDGVAGADPDHELKVRVVSEYAYQSLFARHMFRRLEDDQRKDFDPEYTVLAFPSCHADPANDGTNSEAFIILNLEKKVVIIGGTKYCGEIKKSIFAAMNYLLPEKDVLPMHCSANVGDDGKTALFFGLSGTGKTTLSSDPSRRLIGDDEHGWSERGIFNFEGGCYAKTIKLSQKNEPQIWNAIREGALLENVVLRKDGAPDYDDDKFTENTRAAYPIEYVEDSVPDGVGGHPSVIVFLTADAFGVLPPVAKLDEYGAMYHFLSGYTSKLAGTERGVTEPKAAFSACFGAPFMPRSPQVYAELLRKYVDKYQPDVYLVNTGWFGGAYGKGGRIDLPVTRKIVDSIMDQSLKAAEWRHDDLFNLRVVKSFEGIDQKYLDYEKSWDDQEEYQKKAEALAKLFKENFQIKYPNAPKEVLEKGPRA